MEQITSMLCIEEAETTQALYCIVHTFRYLFGHFLSITYPPHSPSFRIYDLIFSCILSSSLLIFVLPLLYIVIITTTLRRLHLYIS